MSDLRALFDGVGVRAGDVILTGNRDHVSVAIQRLTRCDVSHVVLAVGDGMIVEATEYRNLADDRHGGVYLRQLEDALASEYVDHVVVRRPLGVVHDALLASAARFLASQPVFSSSGLVLTGLLVALGRSWTESASDVLFGRAAADRLEAQIAALVADGPRRVVCAEFVYRVLHDAHVPLTHAELFLADSARHLDALTPPAAATAMLGSSTQRLRQAVATAARVPESPDVQSAIARLGWPTFLRVAARQVADGYRRRCAETEDGDIADLVTPRDFLEMEPFDDVLEARWVRGCWQRL